MEKVREVQKVRVAEVYPDPDQPRKAFDLEGIQGLAKSIEHNGLLNPISVRRNGHGYMIIAGERRWRAHSYLRREMIEVIVEEDCEEKRSRQLQLIENLNREDLTPIEIANAYQGFLDDGYTEDELSKITGKPKNIITLQLSLLKVRDDIKHLIDRGQVSTKIGWGLSKLSSEGQYRAIRIMTTNRLGVAETLNVAQRIEAEENSVRLISQEEAPILEKEELKVRGRVEVAIEKAGSVLQEISKIENEEPGITSKALADKLQVTVEKVSYLISELNKIKVSLTVQRISLLDFTEPVAL